VGERGRTWPNLGADRSAVVGNLVALPGIGRVRPALLHDSFSHLSSRTESRLVEIVTGGV
jgi:hypothetical protein